MEIGRAWMIGALLLAGCATQGEVGPPREPAAQSLAAEAAEAAEAPPAATVPAPVASSPEAAAALAGAPPAAGPAAPSAPAATAPPAAPAAKPAPETWDFKIERSERWPRPERGLGTMSYPPSEAEKPFFKRLAEQGVAGYVPVDSLPRKVGTWGSWLGVVRGYRPDADRRQTRLLVESKHFDGLTDTHILCVSFRGGGDFVAVLPGEGHAMSGLSLVRVYGTIVSVKDDVPRVRAEFVREFPLGQYCFMNMFGEDHGNPRWRELCKADLSGDDPDVYDPTPDLDYYLKLLGHPRDFVEGKIQVEVPLD